MRFVCKVVLVAGIAVLMASPALAQQRGRGGRGFGGFGGFGGRGGTQDPSSLVRIEQVRKELKISTEDYEKIRKAQQEAQEKALRAALSADQMKRIEQIQLQLRGGFALKEEAIQKKLKLNASQKDDLQTLFGDYDAAVKEATKRGEGGRFDFQAVRKLAGMRTEVGEKALTVLTSSQKQTWTELTGATFKLERGRRGRGTRPGTRPGTRRGRGRPGGADGKKAERPKRPGG